MRSTLLHIPNEAFGLPLFGFGLLLAIWSVAFASYLAWRVYRFGWTKEIWAELPMFAAISAAIVYVLPAVADRQGIPIRGYGVMVFLGVASAVGLAVRRAKHEGFPAELIYSMAIWLVISGIVGGRLFYVIEYWRDFQKESFLGTLGAALKYTEGGLVVYGAFLGGAAAAVAFLLRNKLPVWQFGDIISPSVMLGLALGRIGCFLNGCCYGGPCDLPWAVTFPKDSPAYQEQASRGLLGEPPILAQRSLPVHPTQLYSSIDALLITSVLLAWSPFRRHHGELVAMMMTVYPIARILEEAIRIDEPKRFFTQLTISQNISLLLLAGAVAVWIYVLHQPRLQYAPAAT
ncbi:MAG: prolipoprotein diacylglyceryl transferase [Pirellulales bacterium]|nr:prolipoprotein diacylglyceryl transferase [Pirellulales bacterium]